MLITKKTDFPGGVSMTNFIKRTWSRVKAPLLLLFCILRPCHSLLLCFQASVAEEKVYILGYVETIPDSFWRRHEKLSGKSMNSNGPGARFSKGPQTFRARKAVLCFLCLHSRSKLQ